MKVTGISYGRTFGLPNFESVRVDISVDLLPDESVEGALDLIAGEVKNYKVSRFDTQPRRLEPMDIRGRLEGANISVVLKDSNKRSYVIQDGRASSAEPPLGGTTISGSSLPTANPKGSVLPPVQRPPFPPEPAAEPPLFPPPSFPGAVEFPESSAVPFDAVDISSFPEAQAGFPEESSVIVEDGLLGSEGFDPSQIRSVK